MKKQLAAIALSTIFSTSCLAATFNLDSLIADPAILGKIISKHKIITALKHGKSINIIKQGKLTLFPDGQVKGSGRGGAMFDEKTDVLQIGDATFCNSHVCTGFQINERPKTTYRNPTPHTNAQTSTVAANAISAYATAN